MGLFDAIAGLFGSTTPEKAAQATPAPQQTQPATAPVSSPEPKQESAQLSQNARVITDIITPAIVQLAGNEEGEQRAKRVSDTVAVMTDWASKETVRAYDFAEQSRGATDNLIKAQELSQIMQLNQIEQADAKAMEANKLYREQIAPIDAAISEDTADLAEARKLQNSGNPLSWLWGKLKEEYNNETLATATQQKVALQQSAQINFALNTAERSLTSKQMAAAGKREIMAKSIVTRLQAQQEISAKELDFIGKQLDLSHKEMADVMSTLNYDLSKQQLSIQKAHLALAQAQEARQKEQWKLSVAQYKDANAAADETYKQLKALGLADKTGTSLIQIRKAYSNPSAADTLTIQAITTGLGGGLSSSIYNSTGVANLRYEDIASNPTLAVTNPEFVQFKNATDSAMQEYLATPEGQSASAEQRNIKRDSILNAVAETYAQDGQRLITDNKVTIPTLALMADTQKNFEVYNQKALDALKTLQTRINTPTDNSAFFDSVVGAAETNGVNLDTMAEQLSRNYKQIVAEHRRAGAISVLPSKFVVGLDDNYTGAFNAINGNFNKKVGGVDLLSSKDIYNLLKAASARRKTAAEFQSLRSKGGNPFVQTQLNTEDYASKMRQYMKTGNIKTEY